MRRHAIARAALALLAAALFLPAGAGAQTPAGAPSAAAAPNAAAPGQEADRAVLQRVDRRIADLRTKLHITAAEEPQWQQFADAMRANARQMAQAIAEREQKFRSMNAVENMKSYADISAQHAKNMERLVPAFQNLYNSLSEAQKKTADQLWRSYAERARQRHKG
ncbi:MAG TPA: Spy/CpxP family protein refolding chaperone [Stellaceae bacterium]|nr:Spy/CpxP family protein refolding chaperone [Stellaceae bacterium]